MPQVRLWRRFVPPLHTRNIAVLGRPLCSLIGSFSRAQALFNCANLLVMMKPEKLAYYMVKHASKRVGLQGSRSGRRQATNRCRASGGGSIRRVSDKSHKGRFSPRSRSARIDLIWHFLRLTRGSGGVRSRSPGNGRRGCEAEEPEAAAVRDGGGRRAARSASKNIG